MTASIKPVDSCIDTSAATPTAAATETAAAVPVDRHGLFTYAEALAAGVTQSEVRRQVRLGTWIRLRRGVLVTRTAAARAHEDPASLHVLHAASVVRSLKRLDLVITGRSAAVLHGMPVMCAVPDLVELTGPRDHRGSLPGALLRTSRGTFASDQLTTAQGLPVTTVARTIVDLVMRTTRMEAAVLLDEVLRSGRCSRDDLDAALTASSPRRFRAEIRSLLDAADPRCGTPLTSAVRRDLADHFITGAEPGHRILVRGHGEVEVPLLWPRQRVALLDASDPDDERTQSLRQVLHATGWTSVITTWTEVQHRPHELRDRVRAALHQRDQRN